jgi:hypothetical protein
VESLKLQRVSRLSPASYNCPKLSEESGYGLWVRGITVTASEKRTMDGVGRFGETR